MNSNGNFIDRYWHIPFSLTGVFAGAALVSQGSPALGAACLLGGTIGCVQAVKSTMNRNVDRIGKRRGSNLDP